MKLNRYLVGGALIFVGLVVGLMVFVITLVGWTGAAVMFTGCVLLGLAITAGLSLIDVGMKKSKQGEPQ